MGFERPVNVHASFGRFSKKLARIKFLLQEAVTIHSCKERGFELIYYNPKHPKKDNRLLKFYFYGNDFPDDLKKSEV